MTVNDCSEIHDFVCRVLSTRVEGDKVVIDLDSVDPALALTIAMHIRLSVADIRQAAFLPILLVSFLPLQSFLTLGECSQLFLSSEGLSFCSPTEAKAVTEVITGLSEENYKSAFLDKIQIHPDDTIGRHSMANQWGADVLYRLVCKDDPQETGEIKQAKKKLYYKYIYLKTINLNETLCENRDTGFRRNQSINAIGKHILLIDDEADRGWSDVLGKWLLGHKAFDVENHSVSDYEDIRDDIRQKIEADYYDLYLLDLRLLGNEEDDIYDANEFSGMKLLKRIKDINKGNQIIIMTASNKAWNMKALLDAGADGYYIKESPELQLPLSFSEANFKAFKDNVALALKQGYKRALFRNFQQLETDILASPKLDTDQAGDLLAILRSAFRQLSAAQSKLDFAYAYLSLYQSLEKIRDFYVTEDGDDGWLINGLHELRHYDCKGAKIIPRDKILSSETKYPSINDSLLGIYVEMCKGTDPRFEVYDLQYAIGRRHAFVHNNKKKLADTKIAEIYTHEGFKHLYHVVTTILRPII